MDIERVAVNRLPMEAPPWSHTRPRPAARLAHDPAPEVMIAYWDCSFFNFFARRRPVALRRFVPCEKLPGGV